MKTNKPIPFYFITTNKEEDLNLQAAEENMKALKDAGYGGAILFNKPPYGFTAEEYLSDKWFFALENFIKAGLKYDLEIWINDGFNFPPGDAGGRVQKIDNTLWAYRLVKKDGKVVPEQVDWGFPAFENPRSSELFIEIVYEEYKKRLGKYFGAGIKGFFSDADNRRVFYRAFVSDPWERVYFPWSENFEETFYKKYGYDITPYLEQILNFEDISQAADYWEHSGDLYQSWCRANAKWCHENGLLYSFHTSDTSPLPISVTERSSAFTEGRAINFESIADYCGVDQELLAINGGLHYVAEQMYTPEIKYGETGEYKFPNYYSALGDVRTKQAQSAAFLYGRSGVMCEMFAAAGWGAGYEHLREIAAFQIMQGANFVVEHAVHHRLKGELKFFAPPIFCITGDLKYGLKEFNDTISKWVLLADKGELIAQVAVLDITKDLWRNRADSELFLEVCHKLNAMPQGYVIASEEEIAANKDKFSLVVSTSKYSDDVIAGIQVLKVASAEDLSKVEFLVPCANRYEGEGNPHYMRRRLADGSEAILIGNIEDGRKISGNAVFAGEKYELCLEPGEIAYFSNEEKHYTKPVSGKTIPIPEKMEVKWKDDNIVPLVSWINNSGKTVLKTGDDAEICASFTVEEGARLNKLYIPKEDQENILKIEGISLSEAEDTFVFDDPYVCYAIDTKTGPNTVKIYKKGALGENNRIFIKGDFDVCVNNIGGNDICCLEQYNLKTYISEKCEIVLKKRRTVLDTDRSAAEQGHPFYCGMLTYNTEVLLENEEKNYILELGETPNYVKAYVNDECIGEGVFKPYSFSFKAKGKTKISIEVCTTGANFVELWSAPFGMLEGGRIRISE